MRLPIIQICCVQLLLLLLFCSNNEAQTLSSVKFDSYYSEYSKRVKGLSQNTVFSIMQDSRGFVWVGTWDGLNRFDGYSFKVFRPNYSDSKNSISNESINDIAEDIYGNVWIATNKGLNKYIYADNSFESFFYSFVKRNSLPSDSIFCIEPCQNGDVWVGTARGLCLYNSAKKAFFSNEYLSEKKYKFPLVKINDILLDANTLWIATSAGFYSINSQNFKTQKYNCFTHEGCCFKRIIKVGKSNLFVATNCGLLSFDIGKKTWTDFNDKPDAPVNEDITSLTNDAIGNVWIGSAKSGLFLYNIESNTFKNLYCSINSRYGLSNNNILSLATSDNGVIWVGTRNGLNKYSQYSYKFEHFMAVSQDFEQGQNIVWSMGEISDGNLVIGTDIGLVMFNVSDKTSKPLRINSIGKNKISSLYVDDNDIIWAGTEGRGLFLVDKNGTLIRNFTSVDNEIFSTNIKRIIKDREGNFWFATYGGVAVYDPKTDKFTNYTSLGYDSETNISNSMVSAIIEDRYGVIWLGTYSGLNRFDPKTKKFFVFRNVPGDKKSLSNDRIFSIYEDLDGIIWIGTMGGGLNRYDRKTGSISRVGLKDGLANNMVYDILEDKNGSLWLTSNKGLIRYNKKNEQIVYYDVSDGVQSLEFNLGAAIKTKDDRIAVGGMNGFNFFNPQNIKQNEHEPNIVFTDFYILGELYDKYLKDGDKIILNSDNNFFTIRFSSLDYANPLKSKYAYRLKNYDKEWIYTTADSRSAEYTNVAPGEYVFEVKACNSDGVWNEKCISLLVTVEPPFYQTWHFRILMFVIIVFFSWIFVRSQIRKIKKKNEAKSKMLEIERNMFELEQKALRLQMNPHFIFNSLNSIQGFILKNDTDKSMSYLAKFSRLMRLVLIASRESFISLENELNILNYYLEIECLRFNNNFDYEIHVEPDIDTEFIGIPPMIIQPHVENAILHGFMNKKDGRGKIIITLWKKKDYILCIVEDNGIGRKKAMENKKRNGLNTKSQGIMITQERLELLSKMEDGKLLIEIVDMFNDRGEATGTRVRIKIPYKIL